MSTCNHRLDLQTLGSQPIVPKNLPDHCLAGVYILPQMLLRVPESSYWESSVSFDLRVGVGLTS